VKRLTEPELVDLGLASLAEMFGLRAESLARGLIASRAINWGDDPFARGAYSYATPTTRDAQAALRKPGGRVLFSGEALYAGRDMGTVEAALASGQETAELILSANR
jgi:monoamine oxidase